MNASQPVFSVIIPTYSRPQQIKDCLESLTALNYPRDDFEVVVVDDGSPMDLQPIVNKFIDTLNLRLIKQSNSGPAKARNTGAQAARGEFLVFTDDDCQPHPNWLKAFASGFETAPNSILGGHTLNKLSDNIYSEASQLLIDYLYQYYNSLGQKPLFFASNNIALPKAVFEQMGRFNTNFPLAAAEDREFCDRALQGGYVLNYVPEAEIDHAHYLTLPKFWRQHFNYGRGAYVFHQIKAKRQQEKIKVEPISFYLNLLGYPLVRKSLTQGTLIAALFWLSQVANAAGFFKQKLATAP
ncbi:glycosyltransferase family 2 protein [Gloeocapsa sp. PCC 73106]|uniref:glycosyltransferase n=1 Tax=Gloeocapsa sp. PCC 73106 TaxID=102232 RepID=UPI0002ABE551|nr:glycosyltransferase [Gloeocapsa sp. PCC 73106]ELR97378.1 glycosyl transferase [Gloeocapsa sp. PCC 73106]